MPRPLRSAFVLLASTVVLGLTMPTGASAMISDLELVEEVLPTGGELLCSNCYDASRFCPDDEPVLLTWQSHGPPDAVVLALSGMPECVEYEDGCAGLLVGSCGGSEDWDAEATELASLLEVALSAEDYLEASRLMVTDPRIGTFIADRGVVVVHSSECTGGVKAVVPVDAAFAPSA